VADYKDFNDSVGVGGVAGDYPYRAVLPFTQDPARIVTAINSVQTPSGSGGDVPESVYFALRRTIDGNDLGNWRNGSVNRIILLIGDAPPRDPEPVTGLTLSQVVAAAARQPNKRISALQIGVDATTYAYFTGLAAAQAVRSPARRTPMMLLTL